MVLGAFGLGSCAGLDASALARPILIIAPAPSAAYKCAHMTASELFKEISPALAFRIVDEVHGSDKDLYRVALMAAAQVKKVRPVFLERQPRADRHRAVATALARHDLNMVAGNVLSGWLVKTQPALLAQFLDALQIKHDHGVVESLPAQVGDQALQAAVESLLGQHAPEIVGLYLRAFHHMNDANWPNMKKLLDEDVRLMLGA